MNTVVQDTTLQKSDDMYRLLIQNALTSLNSPNPSTNFANQVYLSQYIYPGWTGLLQSSIEKARQKNDEAVKGCIGFIVVFALLLLIFWIIIVKLVLDINEVANEICLIFVGLDHRAIVA